MTSPTRLNHHDNSSIDDEDEVFLPSSPTSRNMHRTRNPRFISQHTPTASLRGSFERLNLDATRASVEFSPASRGMIDGVDKPPPVSSSSSEMLFLYANVCTYETAGYGLERLLHVTLFEYFCVLFVMSGERRSLMSSSAFLNLIGGSS